MATERNLHDHMLQSCEQMLPWIKEVWERDWPSMSHQDRVEFLYVHVDDTVRYVAELRQARADGRLTKIQGDRALRVEQLFNEVIPIIARMERSVGEVAPREQAAAGG